jgi:hypothetical protein
VADRAENWVRNRLAELAGREPGEIRLDQPIERYVEELGLVTVLMELDEERGPTPEPGQLRTVADLVAHVRDCER